MTGMPKNWWQALGLAWELGYIIALPLVLFALAGRLLDRLWSTSPWLLLTGVILAILSSTLLVYRKAKSILSAPSLHDDAPPPRTGKSGGGVL